MVNTKYQTYLEGLYNQFPTFASFDNHLKLIFQNREQIIVSEKDDLSKKSAGVLFSLVLPTNIEELKDQPFLASVYLLLEKRSKHMKHSPGDVAFPGGTRDPEDKDIIATAYREAKEELGVNPNALQFISLMDEFVLTDNLVIYPVISWLFLDSAESDFQGLIVKKFSPKTLETEETIAVPLITLLNPEYYTSTEYNIERRRTNSRIGYIRYFNISQYSQDTSIWGLTASVIRRFINSVFPQNLLIHEPTT